jgi:hypothetical protein
MVPKTTTMMATMVVARVQRGSDDDGDNGGKERKE